MHRVRVAMAVVAMVMLPMVAVVCSAIILSDSFSSVVVTAASGALFVDVLGIVGTTWKLVLQQPDGTKALAPVTSRSDSLPTQADVRRNAGDGAAGSRP